MYRVTITEKATDRHHITNHLLFYSALREVLKHDSRKALTSISDWAIYDQTMVCETTNHIYEIKRIGKPLLCTPNIISAIIAFILATIITIFIVGC